MRTCKEFFLILVLVTLVPAYADQITSNATITNYETPGNLKISKDIGCITPAELSNKYTPPDLISGMIKCIKSGRDNDASYLFVLAGLYATYDSMRVSDSTAHQAHTVLVMNAFNSITAPEKQRFRSSLQATLGDQAKLPAACDTIRKIGSPDYYPTYMIQHGMNAVLGSKEGALVENFDSSIAWTKSLDQYLHCPNI